MENNTLLIEEPLLDVQSHGTQIYIEGNTFLFAWFLLLLSVAFIAAYQYKH